MWNLEIINAARALPGEIGICLGGACGEERLCMNAEKPLIAASVIKLAVLLEAFRRFESGEMNPDAPYTVRAEDKVPSCGALTYLHDGLSVTLRDLATLMIIVSDNTATNILIDRLGIEAVNHTLAECGLYGMRLRRKMFDAQAAARGLQNTVTAESVADFFEKLYLRALISPRASEEMLKILGDQRLNGKIPFFLHAHGIHSAHKTGEDDGVSHDAGIIFTKPARIAVFLSNHTDVPRFERFIQDSCRTLL